MDSMTGNTELLSLTADIVSSHVSNNSVAVSDLPGLISNVYASLASLGTAAVPEKAKQEPAVSIRASIKPDYIVCLEDGKKLKMLKRHLMTSYGMTPDAYRTKWGLTADYPMVAPNYAERLGNKRVAPAAAAAPAPRVAKAVAPAEPKPRGRRKLVVAAPKN
jgi:predicted transcriptional regulator